MNVWVEGLQVALIGLLVVFTGLVILILVISLIRAFSVKDKPAPKKPAAAPAPVQAAPAQAPVDVVPQKEPELVAAITAAIACMLAEGTPTAQPGGFVVRRIRRV